MTTGTPNRLAAYDSTGTLATGPGAVGGPSGAWLGLGSATSPGQLLHLGDGNLLVDGGGELAFVLKRGFTAGPGPGGWITRPADGLSPSPIFQIGRIIAAGDGDPEVRLIYSDDSAGERSVFEVDRKGIVASVKSGYTAGGPTAPSYGAIARGSHFEGFLGLTEAEPVFRLNSWPFMGLELGDGAGSAVDVRLGRPAQETLTAYILDPSTGLEAAGAGKLTVAGPGATTGSVATLSAGDVSISLVADDGGTIVMTGLTGSLAEDVLVIDDAGTVGRRPAPVGFRTTTAATTIAAGDRTLVVLGTSPVTLTLPAATAGRELQLLNHSSATVTLSVAVLTGAATSVTTLTAGSSAVIVGDGTDWRRVAVG